jgi:hypothetical protein
MKRKIIKLIAIISTSLCFGIVAIILLMDNFFQEWFNEHLFRTQEAIYLGYLVSILSIIGLIAWNIIVWSKTNLMR